MKASTLLCGTALAAILCTGALAQEQKRGGEGMQGTQQETPQGAPQHQQKSEQPAQKNQAQGQNNGANTGKQAEPKAQPGSPQTNQKQATPNAKDAPNNSKKADAPATGNKNDAGKSASETKTGADKNKSAETPRPDGKSTADNKAGSESKGKTQLSETQRTDVHRDILKDSKVNRVNVNVQVRIGERVPRTVRLAPVPAAVITIVPAYKAYRYFVVEERVVIVDPATYEIVEVIMPGEHGQMASNTGGQHLMLTAEEREIVLREVDIRSGDSTLGIGALSEGADVPRSVRLMEMPAPVVERVSKLRGHKYFVADHRIAIVDGSGAKIALVLDEKN